MSTFDLTTKQKMKTIVGAYEGFVLYLRVPLLVQDDSDYDESSALDIESDELNSSDNKFCSTKRTSEPHNVCSCVPSAMFLPKDARSLGLINLRP